MGNNCKNKSNTKLLGYVSAVIRGVTAPERKDVIWAFPISSSAFDLRVWTGTEWVSILGAPVSGTGVYDSALNELTEMVSDVGGIPEGTSVGNLNGQSFSALFDQLLFPTIPPVYESPSALLQGSNPKLLKVGDSADITLNASFDQADAGAVASFELYRGVSLISALDSFTDLGVVENAPGVVTYEGIYNYAQGPVLNDSNGDPDSSGQISAGSIGTNEVDYEWIYPWFWGKTTTPGTIDIDAEGTEVLEQIGSSIQVNFGSNSSEFLWFAVPAGEPAFTAWLVTQLNQGNIGSPSDLFGAGQVVQVSSGNFSNVDYDLYISNFATEVTTPMTISQ